METKVVLQDGHSYSLIPIIILAVLVIGYLLYLIISLIVKYVNNKPKKPVIVRPTVDIYQVKMKYITNLDKVKYDFDNGNTSIRETYQLMSGIIREFIESATGINVSSYSLQDIRTLNMPVLETLVSEYYAPEFARESKGDVLTSYDKTRKAIELWN